MVNPVNLKKIAFLIVAIPVINLSAANTILARGEGEEFNRQGGSGYKEQVNRQGGGAYTHSNEENYHRNYSGEYGNAGEAAKGYSRGYEQGANSSEGGGYSQIYVQPQQPYNTEPPVNQAYQYQYPN